MAGVGYWPYACTADRRWWRAADGMREEAWDGNRGAMHPVLGPGLACQDLDLAYREREEARAARAIAGSPPTHRPHTQTCLSSHHIGRGVSPFAAWTRLHPTGQSLLTPICADPDSGTCPATSLPRAFSSLLSFVALLFVLVHCKHMQHRHTHAPTPSISP